MSKSFAQMHTEYLTPPTDAAEEAAESFLEELFAHEDMKFFDWINEERADRLALWIWGKISEAYAAGYKDGQSDEAQARDSQVYLGV